MPTEPHPNYIDLSPHKYSQLLENINSVRRDDLTNLLQQIMDTPPKDLCAVVVGSDGKQERHAQSRTEMVFISQEHYPHIQQVLRELLAPYQGSHHLEFDYHGLPGYWWMGQESPFAYQYQLPDKIYPGFILNSIPIFGFNDTFYAMRKRVFQELCGPIPIARKINHAMRKQLKEHRRTIKTGKSGTKTYFNQEDGTIFYDDRNHVLGLKGSFIRGIQRAVGLHVVKLVNDDPSIITDLVKSFPSRTIDRIAFLHSVGAIPESMRDTTIEAYNWSLQMHHVIQEMFKNEGESKEVTMQCDISHLHQNQDLALQFCYSI